MQCSYILKNFQTLATIVSSVCMSFTNCKHSLLVRSVLAIDRQKCKQLPMLSIAGQNKPVQLPPTTLCYEVSQSS